MLKFYRRPVAQRARNIGVWFNMMTILSKIAVASSVRILFQYIYVAYMIDNYQAMIIAFSSNLIPELVYKASTNDESLEGYLNFTLAYFNTKDFEVN